MSHHLHLVTTPPVEAVPEIRFCGHCGEPPPTPMAARSRVCSLCGLGVVIAAGEDVAPRPGAPFVIVDGALTLCAMSASAEELLGVSEPDAVHSHVAELLEPADAEAGGEDALLRSILAVAGGREASHTVVVRPAGEYGVRFAARLGRCGPPAAALLVLDDGTV